MLFERVFVVIILIVFIIISLEDTQFRLIRFLSLFIRLSHCLLMRARRSWYPQTFLIILLFALDFRITLKSRSEIILINIHIFLWFTSEELDFRILIELNLILDYLDGYLIELKVFLEGVKLDWGFEFGLGKGSLLRFWVHLPILELLDRQRLLLGTERLL